MIVFFLLHFSPHVQEAKCTALGHQTDSQDNETDKSHPITTT